MTARGDGRVAILYPGDLETRRGATTENNRFADLFRAFAAAGMPAAPAVYHPDFCAEVREQLLGFDGVLVWCNPLEGGRDRSILDAMLRDVAAAGVFVSAHPDIIKKLGTKEVLYRTRGIGWGCDTHLYASPEELRREFPLCLARGKPRVLKQYRGNGGIGVWKAQLPPTSNPGAATEDAGAPPAPGTTIRVHHAQRGCAEEEITLGHFMERCEPYFAGNAPMIDQEFQERITDGMIRCYLVQDRVEGFGHQAINALFPPPAWAPADAAPPPGPRLYHPPDQAEFQALKAKLEREWVPALCQLLEIGVDRLPLLWDCDFLFGPRDDDGQDTYVLCEINVSSVAPYPPSVVPAIVAAWAGRRAPEET